MPRDEVVERDTPQGEREVWAEGEAKQCDSFMLYAAEQLRESVDKLAKDLTATSPHRLGYLYLRTQNIHDAAVRMNAYYTQAENLRRSRRMRIEMEAYANAKG